VIDDEPPIRPSDTGATRLWPALRAVLRTRLVAGLLTVIPIWVTYVVVRFVFDMMRNATEPLAERMAKLIIEQNKHLVPAVVRGYFTDWVVPVVAVLLTMFLLYTLGLLTANVFGRRVIRFFESMFEKVPMVKTIYRSTKQIVMTIGGHDKLRFQRAVLIEFPRPGMKRVAFLTSVMTDRDTGRQLANIFIPYTPYLTTGYMQIVPLEEVSETDWTVEEAVKLIMSGGIISPPSVAFDHLHPVHLDQLKEPVQPQPHAVKHQV
jgi:uncharacterized membrane protein